MSTPQATEHVEGRHASDAAQTVQPNATAPGPKTDYSAYIEKATTWNNYPLQPWRIAMLVQSNKIYAVLERKELHFDLLDWFEDARIGAVMRGEKIVTETDFWHQLYRQSIGAIQQHFGTLSVHILDGVPPGKIDIFFGEKVKKPHDNPMPSPIANRHQLKQKRKPFKQRS